MVTGELMERVVARAGARRVPFGVLVELTHRCNLPCKHCYLPDHDDHGELCFDELVDLFDQLADAGTFFLTLTGGEVMARRDFLEIVDAAAARGFALKVLSNATLFTDEAAARLARAGVLEVSVSVYGASAQIHDLVTDMPGSFARTMAGVERLRAHGLHVALKTPLLTLNGGSARDVHAMARAMDLPCRFDMTITPKNDGATGPLALQLQHAEMVRILGQEPFRDRFGDIDGPGPSPCNAGRTYCAVGPTGDVMACIMMPGVLGNIRERSFADIWAGGALLDELRALTAADLHACTECSVKGACTRCPGLAMHRGQGPAGCDLSAREVAKARVDAKRLRVIA